MKKKRILVFSLIFFVSGFLVLYFLRIYPFLAYHNPVQPDVLIVEGWLPEEITVTARGTKAYNEYPHFRVYADTVLMGETFVNSKTHDYTFTERLDFRPGSVIIEYDND